MGGAENDVNRIRPAFQNRRHGIDHDLDALVGREQTERQNDRSVAEPELGFGSVWLEEFKLRNAVRDDFDLFVGHLVNGAQQFAALFGHDDDLG